MRIETIAPSLPFADTVARLWLDACDHDPIRAGDGLILVPTRRLTRSLAEAFMRAAPGPALLLPRFAAIGDADDAALAPITPALAALPPPIARTERLALLSRLVLARGGRGGAPDTLDRAWPLAVELARLLDEAARAAIALGPALAGVVPAELAEHWQVTLDFLRIATEAWPAILAERGVLDPADRQARVLRTLAEGWRVHPPAVPVWLAGANAATASEARLAGAIATLPRGRVLLPGLDRALPDDTWDALDDNHPQAGLRRLLERVGVRRDEVDVVDGDAVPPARAGRVALLRRAFLPAAAVGDSWRDPDPSIDPDGITLIDAADEAEEALAIAVALRDAVETPGARAALVTPDRALAARVAAALDRFGIVADDSAGEPLAATPSAVLLRLLAAVVAEGLPPVPLLALLEHPFSAFGLTPAGCRHAARLLERRVLRGPRLPPGLDALRAALDRAAAAERSPLRPGEHEVLRLLLDRVAHALAPVLALGDRAEPARTVAALVESAERVVETDIPDPVPAGQGGRLWAGTEGETLARELAAHVDALAPFQPEPLALLPALLDALLDGVAVHGERVRRGRAADAAPFGRVDIWGVLEARGQSADLLVLGGLDEGVWPAATDPGPWLGRPMRAAIGLPSPEEAIGLAAHDVTTLLAASPRVVLARAARRDRAPAVPSRWLARLDAALARSDRPGIPPHPALAWVRRLDRPDGPPAPSRPPAPCPPVALRPRRLPVTAIETWQRDPYAIHARHVLRLKPLPALEEDAEHALFGTVVHGGLARAFAADRVGEADLAAALRSELDQTPVRAGLRAWWRPRLDRIAGWVAAAEAARRAGDDGMPDALATECEGEAVLDGPAGPFTLSARADRIERRAGQGLAVFDYKTGMPPGNNEVSEGWAAQLPLEAAIAARGGFGDRFATAEVAALRYWRLSGGANPGEASGLEGEAARDAVDRAWAGLAALLADYDDPARPYLAAPRPGRTIRFADYEQLARVAEWRLADAD